MRQRGFSMRIGAVILSALTAASDCRAIPDIRNQQETRQDMTAPPNVFPPEGGGRVEQIRGTDLWRSGLGIFDRAGNRVGEAVRYVTITGRHLNANPNADVALVARMNDGTLLSLGTGEGMGTWRSQAGNNGRARYSYTLDSSYSPNARGAVLDMLARCDAGPTAVVAQAPAPRPAVNNPPPANNRVAPGGANPPNPYNNFGPPRLEGAPVTQARQVIQAGDNNAAAGAASFQNIPAGQQRQAAQAIIQEREGVAAQLLRHDGLAPASAGQILLAYGDRAAGLGRLYLGRLIQDNPARAGEILRAVDPGALFTAFRPLGSSDFFSRVLRAMSHNGNEAAAANFVRQLPLADQALPGGGVSSLTAGRVMLELAASGQPVDRALAGSILANLRTGGDADRERALTILRTIRDSGRANANDIVQNLWAGAGFQGPVSL